MLRRRRACAIPVCALALAACSPYTRTTVVEVRDPTLVRYSSGGAPLPVSSSSGAVVADHDVVYRGDRFAELIVTARETPNGSLVTSWRSNPPIWAGAREIGVGNAGVLTVPDHVPVSTRGKEDVTIPLCGRYDDLGARARRSAHAISRVSIGVPCDGSEDVSLAASTPWTNVRSVKYVSENDPAPRVVSAVVVSILASVAGTTLLLARDSHDRPLPVAVRDVGIGAFAAGAAIDLAILIPAFSSPSEERTVYEAKGQRDSNPL